MKIIDFKTIRDLQISPVQCMEWVKEVFLHKKEDILPPKISLKLDGNIFFNTMPCYIRQQNRFGVKEVSRFPLHTPSLRSELLLYDADSGNLLALMDATWITAMRTGAVAALAALTFQKKETNRYAFMGLGNTARATLLCLYSQKKVGEKLYIDLLQYKSQAENFVQRFADYPDLVFNIKSNTEQLVSQADVIISCVTACDDLIASDSCFREGVLVIPVHTRGFQNCDLFFDKVFADDRGHVEGFKYFERFRYFAEFSDVLTGKAEGRANNRERILSYNIGIALHDIYFAAKLYDECNKDEQTLFNITDKFWI